MSVGESYGKGQITFRPAWPWRSLIMLLDRIDIDAHGPLSRVELGPFCEHLNVICGPEGAGKTAIARFIRDSLVHREYPLGMMSSSTGRVVWSDQEGKLHCRREMDGTKVGRQSVEFEPRGDFRSQFDSLHKSWVAGRANRDNQRAMTSIRIPESIVDGVITDTAITSLARVVSACIRSGLDTANGYDTSARLNPADDQRRRELRTKLADIETELAQLNLSGQSEDQLVRRRNELHSQSNRQRNATTSSYDSERRQNDLRVQLSDLENRARQLRNAQSRLRSELAGLETHYQSPPVAVHTVSDEELRRKLDDLDAQMIRWRRTLTEVRGLREAFALQGRSSAFGPNVASRREQLQGFISSIDPYVSVSGASSVQDIKVRIDSATKQIDWLLTRYSDNSGVADWYRPMSSSAVDQNSLAESLRSIRDDLVEVRSTIATASTYTKTVDHSSHHNVNPAEADELVQAETWLSASIELLIRRRIELLRDYAPEMATPSHGNSWNSESNQRERARRTEELGRIELDLNDCLSRAAQVRQSIDLIPSSVDVAKSSWQQDHIVAELNQIDVQLSLYSRATWLRNRRAELIKELGVTRREYSGSPLAAEASHWLVRLSAGRMRQISWPYAAYKSASIGHSIHWDDQTTGVCIDGRDEAICPAADRALAVLAVRLAAGELLAKSGRDVPLVLEINRELLQVADVAHTDINVSGTYSNVHDGRFHHPIISAIHDYASRGRQAVLLTSSQDLAQQVARAGGTTFNLYPTQNVQAHRPVWQPHYQSERYVGPHAQVWGDNVARDYRVAGDYRDPHDYRHQGPGVLRTSVPVNGTTADVNRSFDTAWREAYGLFDNPEGYANYPATDWAVPGEDFRDGFYVNQSYTTDVRARQTAQPRAYVVNEANHLVPVAAPNVGLQNRSPFYLSVDSPIDQAPSIDAIAAARLRGLNVTHINHLMQQDSNRLSDALGLANVDAATIRRWKSECRLVCRVPQLRAFDARVLVGCGVTDPAQLAATPPGELLSRVEDFLATKRGQQILLSGSSYELSRITSWIASARKATGERVYEFDSETGRVGRQVVDGRVIDNAGPVYAFDSDRYEYENDGRVRESRRSSRARSRGSRRNSGYANGYGIAGNGGNGNGYGNGNGSRSAGNGYGSGTRNHSGSGSGAGYGSGSGAGYGSGSGVGNGSGSGGRSGYGQPNRSNRSRSSTRSRSNSGNRSNRSSRSVRDSRDVVRMQRQPREYERETGREQRNSDRERTSRSSRGERSERVSREVQSETRELKFYLQRNSAVVDAPSIGSRMAEKLNAIGIYTVDDLLTADPNTLAEQLEHRRIDADVILTWQQQATLVCRIPMLRGHDAQLLVAAEVTTAEEVTEYDAAELFALIDPIARSNEGKRIIRGGKLPDLEEITEWISYSKQNRELVAA